MSPRVLLIGDATRAEMQAIVGWIERHASSERLHGFADVPEFGRNRDPQQSPDMIVALEAHPDEYSRADVAALFAAAPSGRIVCCAGAWSESAGRNRSVWPLAVRVAAVLAVGRLECEWRLLSDEPTEFLLPPTGSREERFAALHPALHGSQFPTRVEIRSPDPAYRQMLTDLLTTAGATVVTDGSPADVMLWDIDPWSPGRLDELRRLLGKNGDRRLAAMTGWITPELERELLNHGIRAVIPKLGDIHEALSAVRHEIAH